MFFLQIIGCLTGTIRTSKTDRSEGFMESKSSSFLKILCYLTILYTLALIGICCFGWFAPDSAGDSIDKLGQINIGLYFAELPMATFYLPMILIGLASLLGAVLMLQLKRLGYLLYFGANMLLLAALAVFYFKFKELFETSDFIFSGALALLIVLFGTQRKYLR